jgi:transcriptional antiterminator NusG
MRMEEEVKNETSEPQAPAQAPEARAEGSAAAAEPGTMPPPTNPNMRWYIIHTYSGFERKVRESLESRKAAYGLEHKIGQVVIPTEPVTEIRGGKRHTTERAFLPGYVLVELEMDLSTPDGQNLWHVVKSTPRVTGFLGAGNQPTPMSEDEVNTIIFRVAESKDKPKLKVKFEKNESVRISEGPFATFTGIVDEVNEDRETLKVMVTIFGRSTPVELEFGQVEKVA